MSETKHTIQRNKHKCFKCNRFTRKLYDYSYTHIGFWCMKCNIGIEYNYNYQLYNVISSDTIFIGVNHDTEQHNIRYYYVEETYLNRYGKDIRLEELYYKIRRKRK
ncbi:unnamed protein product [marine sediment metagenome]|uniref:Uncharacterized protein n=1 Tax=marine sediment metagenome TaxID=412755 RepID=X1SID3_9ZZZZ